MKLIYIRKITHYSSRVNTHRNIVLVDTYRKVFNFSFSFRETSSGWKILLSVIKDDILIRNLTNHSSTENGYVERGSSLM